MFRTTALAVVLGLVSTKGTCPMTRRVALAGLFALAIATPARADYITGVTASTNMVTTEGLIAHIVDGSGLSSLSLTANHALGNATNAWESGVKTGQVTFDLHGAYTLVGMSVWNFNAIPNFGVNGVSVSTSTDGLIFTTLAGGPTSFAIGLSSPEPPQQFTFGPVVADFVRFNITSDYGVSNSTGLNEVGFDGTRTSAVPAPPALVLVGLGAGCVALRRYVGRRATA
jgi:hypothetical protein